MEFGIYKIVIVKWFVVGISGVYFDEDYVDFDGEEYKVKVKEIF